MDFFRFSHWKWQNIFWNTLKIFPLIIKAFFVQLWLSTLKYESECFSWVWCKGMNWNMTHTWLSHPRPMIVPAPLLPPVIISCFRLWTFLPPFVVTSEVSLGADITAMLQVVGSWTLLRKHNLEVNTIQKWICNIFV